MYGESSDSESFVRAALLFATIMLTWALFHRTSSWTSNTTEISPPTRVPLGKSGRSNLEHQPCSSPGDKQLRVVALYIYPIKSCRGIELPSSTVTGLGLRYDRLFSFAQRISRQTDRGYEHEWHFLTQRECPKLALLETKVNITDSSRNVLARKVLLPSGGELIIRFPYETSNILGTRTQTITLSLPLEPWNTAQTLIHNLTNEKIKIWKDYPEAINVTNTIHPIDFAKLQHFLGIKHPFALFRIDDSNLRSVTRSLPKDRPDEEFKVGFADAFPIHLLNMASMRALDEQLPEDSEVKGNLDPRRFRANVYIDGPRAYAEDRWMRVNIGRANGPHASSKPGQYHVACRTARCTLPNTHPDTGVKDRNEPLATLKRTRVVDEGAKPHPCLGLSMIPLFGEGEINVGDTIEVLQTGELVYEKMFN